MNIKCCFGIHDYCIHKKYAKASVFSYDLIDATCRRCGNQIWEATDKFEHDAKKYARAMDKIRKQAKEDVKLNDDYQQRKNFRGR